MMGWCEFEKVYFGLAWLFLYPCQVKQLKNWKT